MIDDRYTYLLVDVFCILVPLIASFHPKVNFYKHWRFFWPPCLFTAVFFIVWDVIFTHRAIWSFNPRYLTGVFVYNLPVEEIAFFICVPYACVFTYFCVASYVQLAGYEKAAAKISVALSVVAMIVACFNYYRLYTAITFGLLSILLAIVARRRVSFMPHFYLSYIIILIPFLLSNGILTGAFTDEPVVLYNSEHNLGLRITTIPVEDAFYAMLLLLMNVSGFRYLSRRSARQLPEPAI